MAGIINFDLGNVGDLAKPVTTLVEKIAGATGIIYEPSRIKKKAEAEAEAKIILAKADIKTHALETRAINRLVMEESRKQKNIESVIGKALPDIDKNANPSLLEDDWLTNFFEKSRNVSDDEMQNAWARILSGETNSPGTYSKRTVNILAELSKLDAEIFTKLTYFSVQLTGGEPFPYIKDIENDIYNKNDIKFKDLEQLDSIGLITFNNVAGYKITDPSVRGGHFDLSYDDTYITVAVTDGAITSMPTGRVSYTQQGLELLKICYATPIKGFKEYIIKTYKEAGLIVTDKTTLS